jgi:polyphosphate kinase
MTEPKYPTDLTPDTYINRELAWIEFNRRVLAEANDTANPLLERLKFLAIFSNNLDEFYMVRVASAHKKLKAGLTRPRPDGYKPSELIHTIRFLVNDLINEHRDIKRDVLSKLAREGVLLASIDDLTPDEQKAVRTYFEREVYPILTPLAVDHARPFPFISNLSLSLAVWLERKDSDTQEFVRIKVPDDIMPRIVSLQTILRASGAPYTPNDDRFIYLEDVISDNLDLLFPGMIITETVPFRVTRNADIDYEYEQDDPDESHDISALIEESLRERRFGQVVRLAVPRSISERTLERLIEGLEVEQDRDVYFIEGSLGAASLFDLYTAVDRPDLRDDPHVPRLPEVFVNSSNIFGAIRQGDILVHHPYDSFGPVEDFFRTAAHDPAVLAIKSTMYRVGKNSPVVQALMEARDNDKQVTALVELKARFDEENNLTWARQMEDKGVHVTYGVEELPVKTHAKIALVVRREGQSVRRYVHLGTGNYNATTARIYTDLGLFTCNEAIGNDATRLFNRLTGYAPGTEYDRLLVAPEYLLPRLHDLIDNEIRVAQEGKPARLIFKMNQLEEDTMISKLYEASQAGVQVDLIVRGLCCLRPGVPGLSENINVVSVIGRFLEHSRIYYFHNAPQPHQMYAGSADLMRRNLWNRVEVVFPIGERRLQQRLLRLLKTQLIDNMGAWDMLPDATFRKRQRPEGEQPIHSQQIFMRDSFGLPMALLEDA